MASLDTVQRGSPPPRAPGVHLIEMTRQRPEQARPQHGVPLFVGFGRRTDAVPVPARPALEIDRWEQFEAWLLPTRDGYLGEAVRGFFSNGGQRCLVLPLQYTAAADDLSKPFDSGGLVEDIVDIDLVCVPDAVNPTLCNATLQVQSAIVRHCEAMADRFAILDAPLSTSQSRKDPLEAAGADAFNSRSLLPKSRFAALYFPGIYAEARPVRQLIGDRSVLVPPCGHVAGVYARSDVRTRVHKAPANEIVEGALALEHDLSGAEHGRLNEAGINCIRHMQGRGIRVMGARTLSNESAWLYVPVARVFAELTRWLKNALGDTVFESHTPLLWQQVQRRISAYCSDLLRAGALAGADAADAFFVKCDAETNPPDSREAGRLVAEVGLAPSIPAEFVVVRVTHDANGIAVTGT